MISNKRILLLLLACLIWLAGPLRAEVSLPKGAVGDIAVDLRVKVLGSYVTVDRQFDQGRWWINRRWSPVELSGLPQESGGCRSYPELKFLERTYSGDGQVWTLENRYSVRATEFFEGTGCAANRLKTLRWRDINTGQWADYQRSDTTSLQFRMARYGDRNNIQVGFDYDAAGRLQAVRDHFGNLIFDYVYNAAGLLTEIRDNPGLIPGNAAPVRSVHYRYDNDGLITEVTDVRDYVTRYTFTYPTGSGVAVGSGGGSATYTGPGIKLLSSITDPEGHIRSFEYLGDRVSKEVDAEGHETRYVYDYDKLKKQVYVRITYPDTAAGSRIVENWYGTDGVLIRRDVNGHTELQESPIDPATRTLTRTDATGQITTLVKDEFDHIVKTIQPDGATVSARYSPLHGNLLEWVNELGVKTQYDYDAKGNLLKLTEAVGLPEQRITEYTVNNLGLVTQVTRKGRTESNGKVTPDAAWEMQYNSQGLLTKTTDPEGYINHYDYDLSGNLLSYTDPAKKTWRYTYDPAGNPLTEIDPLGHATTYVSDKVGNTVSDTDALNHTWRWQYDALYREIKSLDPYGATYSTSYNNAGFLAALEDASGQRMGFDYDAMARLVQATDGKGYAYQMDYSDVDGVDKGLRRLGKIRYPTFQRLFRYDKRGSVLQKTDLDNTDSRVENHSYDGANRHTTFTDANGKTYFYEYDAYGQVTQIKNPLGHAAHLLRDAHGNLIELSDPNGHKTSFSYDRRGLLTRTTDPLGHSTHYDYDERGRLINITRANGQSINYGYDGAGYLVRHREYSASGELVKTVDFSYDAVGNLTAWNDGSIKATRHYDNAERLTGETLDYGGFSLSYSYTYHPNSQVKTYTGPDGVQISYSFDSLGQLEQLTIPGEGSLSVTEWEWASPKKVLLPGGAVQKFEYNGFQDLTRLKVLDPGQTTVFELQNQLGQLAEVKTVIQDDTTRDYVYDDVGRLTEVQGSDGTAIETYTLDATGNRIRHSQTGTANWRYDAANQLIERGSITYAYDAAGNLVQKTNTDLTDPQRTTRYEYDAFNRLVKVSDGAGSLIAAYTYDPFDRRLSKTVSGAVTYYLPSRWGLLAETDAEGKVIVSYGWNPQESSSTAPVYARIPNPADGGFRYVYYHNDQLDTPQRLTDRNGQLVWAADYDGFGRATVRSGLTNPATNNLRFPGQYFDTETGLHYNDRRYYDPDTGRYLTRDPIGFEGGINLYAYADASPTRFADPTGEVLPALAYSYLRCFATCMAIGGAGQYLTSCDVDWGGLAQDCGLSCVLSFLPLPDPCGNSFTAETLVQVRPTDVEAKEAQMGKADLKPIGEIKPGDEVLAWSEWKEHGPDPKADARLSYEKVTNVITSQHGQKLVHITLESGETLTATEGHPFYTREGWRDAVLIKKGGQLLLKGDGDRDSENWANVVEVKQETRTVQVFNLEVAKAHTFLVGSDGVVAHNIVKIPRRGPGTTPKNQRDTKRVYPPNEQYKKWKEQGERCAECGQDVDFNDTQGHHEDRHADGGKTNRKNHRQVCKPCHCNLHNGK